MLYQIELKINTMNRNHRPKIFVAAIALALMCQPLAVRADLETGLSAYYAFEESDNLGKDTSTQGKSLTPYTDGAEDDTSGVSSSDGISGKSTFFNPDIFTLGLLQNDGAEIVDTTKDFTWSMWFNMDPKNVGEFVSFGLMSKGPDQVGEIGEEWFAGAMGLILRSDGTLVFDVFDVDLMEFGGNLVDGRWHHAVVTTSVFEEEGEMLVFMAMYVDGSMVSELELPLEDLELAEGSKLRIGSGVPGDIFLEGAWPFDDSESSPSFVGKIDEVRIYNREVSEEEVIELLLNANPEPGPAEIVSQPMGGKAVLGRAGSISVQAKGVLLEYQWFKGDTEIADATEPTLHFEELSLEDSGDYKVVITNISGETTSEVATLEVLEEWDSTVGLLGHWSFEDGDNLGLDSSGNEITLGDNGATQADGSKGKGIETGDGAFLRDDEELMQLDTHQSFTWTAMIKADDSQGNILGKSDDEWAPGNKGIFIRDDRLGYDTGWIGSIEGGPIINDNAWHQVAFRAELVDGEHNLSLFVDGNEVSSSSMPLVDQPDSGVFAIGHASNDFPEFEGQGSPNLPGFIDEVRVYSQALHEDDILSLLTQDGGSFSPAEITSHPADIAIIEGRTAKFSVASIGTRVTYQWQKDGVDIPDATDKSFRVTGASKADAGKYRVIVQSPFIGEAVTSNEATLTVNDAPVFAGGELAHVAPFLESFWTFDSLEDGVVPDLSPVLPKHDGTLELGATITSGGQGFGESGEALDPSTGETNAHMAAGLPETYDFDAAFTWAAWIKISEPAAEGEEQGAGLFGRTPADSGHAAGAKIVFLNALTLGFDQGWVGGFTAENELDLDSWHQVTFIYEPLEDVANISLYLDGEPVLTDGEELAAWEFELSEFAESDDPPREGGPGAVNSGFRIGSGATPVEEAFFSDPFPGLIDNVAVWSTALSPEDVQLLAGGASPLPDQKTGGDAEIGISRDGDSVTITYTGTLLFSPELGEPFTPVDGASSPYSASQPGFYTSRSE